MIRKLILAILLVLACSVGALATDITVGGLQINNFQRPGTSAQIRIWYSSPSGQNIVDSNGVPILVGAVGTSSVYKIVTCSLNSSTHVLTIPSFTIPSTNDSSQPNSRVTARIYDSAGTPVTYLFTNWIVPYQLGASPTFAQLNTYNAASPVQPAPSYPTTDQVLVLINSAVGTLNDASTTVKGRTYLDVDPTVPSHPEAVGSNSARVPPAGAYYYALNYSTFAAAVTAMGTTVPVRLIVSEQMAVAVDITVTPNIQLQFVGNGRLIVATNKTVTIQGSLIASPSQWIFDVSASGAVVSFSGNNFVTAYYPQWYGVTGDGATDDTTALQAFTDQIPATSAHSIFTRGLVIKITSTWKIWGKYSWLLESATVMGNGSSDARQVPTIRWAGADGGVVIDISKTRDSTFRGLYVDMNGNGGSTHGADTGIWLNQLNANVGDICTSNIFEYININANSARPNITIVDIGDSTNSNVEFMQFNYCVFSGNTNPNIDSGVFGASRLVYMHTQNTLAHKFRKTAWNRAHIGIDCQYGSFSSEGGEGGVLEIAYRIGNLIGPSRISDDRLENVRQPISTVGSGGSDRSLTCITNDWPSLGVVGAATAAYPFIDWSLAGGAPLILIGNFIGDFRGFLPGGASVNNPLVTDVFKGVGNGPSSAYGTGGNVLTAFGNVTYGVDSSVLSKNYTTFYLANVDGRVFSGNATASGQAWSNTLDFITSTGLRRAGLGQASANFDRRRIAGDNNLFLGDGEVEFLGVPMPNPPKITIVGVYGTAFYEFAVVAYDAGGNRTPRSEINVTGVANATLSGSNYIKLDWADIPGSAGGVDIINTVNNGDTFQLVAHVASGVTTYNVVTNPAGAFTYALPTYNETMRMGLRGPVYPINIIIFTDGATTPSVKQSNTFKTANTAPTTITNFTQGVDGQQITVIMRDANTTIANGGSINTRSGADIVPAVNRSYSFVREGGVWIQVN